MSPLFRSAVGIDRALFRQVMGQFLSAVTVVTTTTPEGFHGLTANAFCAVSDDPPLVLVCVDRLARSRDHLLASGLFAVNVLAETQEFLADRLAGRAPGPSRHFEGVPYATAATSAPILEGCVAWLDCRLQASYEAGDHTLLLGRVLAMGAKEGAAPLLYFRSAYARLA